MIVYGSKWRSLHGFSRGEAVKNLRFLTDEECGRKSDGYASVSGFYKPTDFAIPHPTSLPLGHLPPGGRYNGCGGLRKINDHLAGRYRKKGMKKLPPGNSGGRYFQRNQASLFSFRVRLLFLRAALFLCRRPCLTAWSTDLTATA